MREGTTGEGTDRSSCRNFIHNHFYTNLQNMFQLRKPRSWTNVILHVQCFDKDKDNLFSPFYYEIISIRTDGLLSLIKLLDCLTNYKDFNN